MSAQQNCDACSLANRECILQPLNDKCGECISRSIPCVFRTASVEFQFVNENQVAATASRRAASRRSRRQLTIPLDISAFDRRQDAAPAAGPAVALAAPILHLLEDRVLQRFISRWAAYQTCLGCLDSMPVLLEASGRDSAMHSAILAAAYADLAIYERHGDRVAKSIQAYSITLGRLQRELSRADFVATDATLATILTIDAFELLYMNRTEPLGIHTQGIVRLLELRKGDETLNREQSYPLWRSAYERIHLRQIYCGLPAFSHLSVRDFGFEDDNQIEFVTRACDILFQIEHQKDPEELTRLSNTLRTLTEEAQEWSKNNIVPPRQEPNPNAPPELVPLFNQRTIVVYDSIRTARDQLLFTICNAKILDALLNMRAQAFSQSHAGSNDVSATRDFLLGAQPDLASLEAMGKFVLGVIPLLLGLVDTNGMPKLEPWTLNDTGVLTIKSPLKILARLDYVSAEIKRTAVDMLAFLDAHRHVMQPP